MSRSLSSTSWILAVAFGLCAGLVVARSSAAPRIPTASPAADALATSGRDADLVFEGVVEAIAYRESDRARPGDLSMPHTYVTFRVERLFKGAVVNGVDGRLTLRFLGGIDSSGHLLELSHGARFELGSREILFVRNHEVWGTPLVAEPRRFVLSGGRAFSERGNPLQWPSSLPREDIGLDDGVDREPSGGDLSAEALRTWIEMTMADELARAETSADAPTVMPVRSVTIAEPFFMPALGLRSPDVPDVPATPPGINDEDRREVEALLNNGHNPVLPESR